MSLIPLLVDLTPWAVVAIVLLLVSAVLLIVHMVRTSNVPMLVRIRVIGLWVQRGPDAAFNTHTAEATPRPVSPNDGESDTDLAPPSPRDGERRDRRSN
jgi:hypothetical protein